MAGGRIFLKYFSAKTVQNHGFLLKLDSKIAYFFACGGLQRLSILLKYVLCISSG